MIQIFICFTFFNPYQKENLFFLKTLFIAVLILLYSFFIQNHWRKLLIKKSKIKKRLNYKNKKREFLKSSSKNVENDDT